MNELLQEKLDSLENANDYECWYLVKQDTSFASLCYQVEYLRQFQEDTKGYKLENYIKQSVAKLKEEKPDISVSDTYRALRVACFFGLITMTNSNYKDAILTPTFYQILDLCSGEFERIETYSDVIQRQIEKMFISSNIDEEYKGVREKFRLYPVMLLYKILLELGRSTGIYSITINEYRYLVATTNKFEDFLDTLLLIKLLRKNTDVNRNLEEFKSKFDNRLLQALKQLPSLEINAKEIKLATSKIEEISKKVFIFEKNPEIFSTDRYLEFLASTKSLYELEKFEYELNESQRLTGGDNILLYGVPGSGKSYTIDEKYGTDETKMVRVVFHPDYMNTDFVGQILPTIKEDETITYEFTPGPFTKIMKKAYSDPNNHYYLIIEEINRGNAPAIFGEIFQLLDRKDNGESKYKVTNSNVAKEMFGDSEKQIYIPSNLTVLATMNTADQNVFTLDTAFQRRWNMKMIENNVKDAENAKCIISDTGVEWERFNTVINDIILSGNLTAMSSEDKRLGAYFVTKSDLEKVELLTETERRQLTNDEITQRNNEYIASRFSEKVIKYLWDDAFKFSRNDLFNTNYRGLEQIIQSFVGSKGIDRFNIFKKDVKDLLYTNDLPNEQYTTELSDNE